MDPLEKSMTFDSVQTTNKKLKELVTKCHYKFIIILTKFSGHSHPRNLDFFKSISSIKFYLRIFF